MAVKWMMTVLFSVVLMAQANASGYAIKADDFGRGDIRAWENFLNVSATYPVIVYIGVIVNDTKQSPEFMAMLKEIKDRPNIRFFYHGHTHECGSKDKRKYGEFVGVKQDEQLQLFNEAKEWLIENTNSKQIIFSAPCGATDRLTPAALQKAGYDVWIYPKKDKKNIFEGCTIPYTAKVEQPTFNPNYKAFARQYPKLEAIGGEHVLQVHPGAWGGKKLKEFSRILKSMMHHGAMFTQVCKK